MMTLTSFSSRFNARPVMPWPKSSISLSMTSARPSTLATPSPISRMMPTLRLPAATLAPKICASISCTKSAIGHLTAEQLKIRLERRQPGPHAVVIHVAADFDPHAADERRVLGERGGESLAVDARQVGLDGQPFRRRQRHGALDQDHMPIAI